MSNKKIILICILFVLIATFFIFDLNQYFNLELFKSKRAVIDAYYENSPVLTGSIFFFIYVTLTSLSLPAAGIMTLIGGAIFGLIWGTILVSFAASIGATFAFLACRYLFRDTIQNRFENKLKPFNEGIRKDGALYLFTLRLVPIFPFFVINAVMGLTPIRTVTFFIVSQIGMIPATMVFVNAGKQIAKIEEVGDILSPELIASFILLGLFPLIAKKSVDYIKSRTNLNVNE